MSNANGSQRAGPIMLLSSTICTQSATIRHAQARGKRVPAFDLPGRIALGGALSRALPMNASQSNIFAVVLDKVHQANRALMAEGLLPAGIDQSRVVVEPPR